MDKIKAKVYRKKTVEYAETVLQELTRLRDTFTNAEWAEIKSRLDMIIKMNKDEI